MSHCSSAPVEVKALCPRPHGRGASYPPERFTVRVEVALLLGVGAGVVARPGVGRARVEDQRELGQQALD